MSPGRAIPLALLLAVAVRVPFWIEALQTPVDGDTAIVGLMARHSGVGTTLWGQPYGSPLDAWAAMPFVAVWGHSVEALRLPYFLLSLLLVPIAYALARELHPAAGLPAAVLMACPPPYFLLLAALPPPFYPTTIVLCGLILLLAARAGTRLGEADRSLQSRRCCSSGRSRASRCGPTSCPRASSRRRPAGCCCGPAGGGGSFCGRWRRS